MLPVPGGDKEWYLYAARAGLLHGVVCHRSFVSLSTIARCEGSDKSARAATIFIHNGAPQALVGCYVRRRRCQTKATPTNYRSMFLLLGAML